MNFTCLGCLLEAAQYNSLFSPGILLRVLQVLGDERKVLAHLQPQIRLWNPAIVSVDGVVLGQLPGDEPTRQKREKKGGFEFSKSKSLCSQKDIPSSQKQS